jgi:hypothetical protein
MKSRETSDLDVLSTRSMAKFGPLRTRVSLSATTACFRLVAMSPKHAYRTYRISTLEHIATASICIVAPWPLTPVGGFFLEANASRSPGQRPLSGRTSSFSLSSSSEPYIAPFFAKLIGMAGRTSDSHVLRISLHPNQDSAPFSTGHRLSSGSPSDQIRATIPLSRRATAGIDQRTGRLQLHTHASLSWFPELPASRSASDDQLTPHMTSLHYLDDSESPRALISTV